MNYVPGTASLIDDIDSKIPPGGAALAETCVMRSERLSCKTFVGFVPQRSTWCCSGMAEP